MAHHRCSRCKQESYPRHKWKGGVYCDGCMWWIKGGRYTRERIGRSWWGSLWDRLVEITKRVFRHESPGSTKKVAVEAQNTRFKAVEAKARSIPHNPQAVLPQKR